LLKSVGDTTNYLDFKKSKCEICSTPFIFKSILTRDFDCAVLKKNSYIHWGAYIQFILAMLMILILVIGLIILMVIINDNPTINHFVRKLFN
jgi:hypothetical protein